MISLNSLDNFSTGHTTCFRNVLRQLVQVLKGTHGSVGILVIDELQGFLVSNGQRG